MKTVTTQISKLAQRQDAGVLETLTVYLVYYFQLSLLLILKLIK